MASKIDFSKLAHKALGFLVNEGEKEVTTAVRKAIKKSDVHSSQLTLEQHDELVSKVATAYDAIS